MGSVKPRFSATQQSVVCTESECGQIEWSWSGSTFRAFSGPPLRALLRFLRRNLSSKSGKLELAAQAAARQRLASRGQLGGYSRPFGFFGLGPRAQRAAGWKVFCCGLRAAPCTSSRPVLRVVQRAPQRTAQREFEFFTLCKLTSN